MLVARTYNKPPLIEAVCDFRFSSSQPWDWTIPGLLYEQIRDNFPNKTQINIIETTVDANEGKVVQQSQPKMQFAFDACYFYNNQAGLVEVATYQIKEELD